MKANKHKESKRKKRKSRLRMIIKYKKCKNNLKFAKTIRNVSQRFVFVGAAILAKIDRRKSARGRESALLVLNFATLTVE